MLRWSRHTDYEASVQDSLDIVRQFSSVTPLIRFQPSEETRQDGPAKRWSQWNVWKSITSQLISNEVFEKERVGEEEGEECDGLRLFDESFAGF